MTDKFWIAFTNIEELGSSFISRLYSAFSNIEHAWTASPSELVTIGGITKKQIEVFVEKRQQVNPEEKMDYLFERNIKYITFESAEYPQLLKEIHNPPMVLFYRGQLDRCNFNKTLSIVGSRKASQYAKDNLSKILDDFYGTDMTIVSGGAQGIDSVAHESALRNNLSTIAVIGSGLDHIYPASNKDLFRKIEDNFGVVMSEYWCTCEPLPWRFPHRNRIVSGLSRGTLIAEAALKSGALITANLCLEQGRELMCIPGNISNPNTQGIYKLLKDGAALVTNSEDILTAMNWEVSKKSDTNNKNDIFNNLNDQEKEVLDVLMLEDCNVTTLINTTKLDVSDLMIVLTTLELNGYIKQVEGEKYSSLI